MMFLLLGDTPLNLSRSRNTWEDVRGKGTTIYVFQKRPLSRTYGTKREEVPTGYKITRNLKFVLSTMYY
jgi:hypothetical protein